MNLKSISLLTLPAIVMAAPDAEISSPVVQSEFIFEHAPFPSAHASTIVETRPSTVRHAHGRPEHGRGTTSSGRPELVEGRGGLVAAWFGGTREKDPDVGIWLSRREGSRWSAPIEVANGVQPDGKRYPCWNPVLFQPTRGPLILFYKVGPSPSEWWALVRTSTDGGRTWSASTRLPKGFLGPIRAKPVELRDGTMLAGSSTEHDGWVVHMERFSGAWTPEALGAPESWWRSGPLNSAREFGAIQPTILVHSARVLQILCRSRQQVITESWSQDGGLTWSAMRATALPNPSAGIDAVRLEDGRFLLVYNPTTSGRAKLEIAVSNDGKRWRSAVALEDSPGGEYSYPAIIQAGDGLVHVTYTWKRERIKHVVIAPRTMD